jgi:methionyl-tRNA formyltransferase
MSKSKLIFFGNEQLASGVSSSAPVFKALIEAGYDIAYLVINRNQVTSRKKVTFEIEKTAEENGIAILKPEKVADISQDIIDSGAKVGVLAAYGQFVPESVIDLFEFGIINLHPSLLPTYRGSTPIESAILNGDKQTGISLMKLVKEMDAGPLYGFSEIELEGNESKQSIYDHLAEIGAKMLVELLPSILSGDAHLAEQDHEKAISCQSIDKSDGEIIWSKSAVQIEREIRAYKGWPGSYTTLKDVRFVITDGFVADVDGIEGVPFAHEKSFGIHCGHQSIIIKKMVPAGKKEMDGQSFLNGQAKFL